MRGLLRCIGMSLLVVAAGACSRSTELSERPEVFPPPDLAPDSVVARILDYRITSLATEGKPPVVLEDSVVGGNGPDWRDLRGASPHDFPGEAGLMGAESLLPLCASGGALSPGCVPLVTSESTCRESEKRHAARQRSAVEVPKEWFRELTSCSSPPEGGRALPIEVARGISLGAQLVIAPPWPETTEGSLECQEAGLLELATALKQLGLELGRELVLQVHSPPAEEESSLEQALLPAELIVLPEDLRWERKQLLARALRARGRRPVLRLGTGLVEAQETRTLAKQLLWGATTWIQAGPQSPEVQGVVEFARQHRELLGTGEAPVGVLLSLQSWSNMSEEDQRASMARTEATVSLLSEQSVPYQLVLLPPAADADRKSLRMRADLSSFDLLLLVHELSSPSEKLLLKRVVKEAPGRLFSVVDEQRKKKSKRRLASKIRLSELPAILTEKNLAVEWSDGPQTEISRHAVARDGGFSFHLVSEGESPQNRTLFLPAALVTTAEPEWWFHKPEGSSRVPAKAVAETEKPGLKLVLPAFDSWGILEARPVKGVGGIARARVTGARERSVFIRAWEGSADDDLGLSIPEVLFPTPKEPISPAATEVQDEFVWKVESDGSAASFSWPVRPVGVEGTIRPAGDSVALSVTFTNHGTKAYEGVFAGLCLAPSRNKGFPVRFHERTWLVGEEGLRSLSEMRVSTGGAPLHVETPQFAWPAIIEESVARERSIAIAFEHASGIGGNAWGASVCLHIRTKLESLKPEASVTLTGAIYFVEGSVDEAVARLAQEDWGSARRRFGSVPTASSFRDGLPPRRLPPCVVDEQARLDGPAEP